MEDLAELYSVGLKAELTSDELGYLVEEIPKQSFKGTASFHLAVYSTV